MAPPSSEAPSVPVRPPPEWIDKLLASREMAEQRVQAAIAGWCGAPVVPRVLLGEKA